MSPSSRGWAGGPRSRYGKELRQPIQIFWPTTASEAEFGFERTSIQLRDKSGRQSILLGVVANPARLRKPQRSFALDVQIADRVELDARRASTAGFYRKGLALTPNSFATGRQPYTAPGETALAPVPMTIELESPPSNSIPSLAPMSASVSNITFGEI